MCEKTNKKLVLREITDESEKEPFTRDYQQTVHSNEDSNKNRLSCVLPEAETLYYFEVDKGHRNGSEVHCILEDASILVYNKKSKRFITTLLGRPGQIDTYMTKSVICRDKDAITKLYMCAFLNLGYGANFVGTDNVLTGSKLDEFISDKKQVLNKKTD